MSWNPDDETNEKVPTPTYEKRDEDTVAWLYKQVAPAIRRVLKAGAFDMADWLEMIYKSDEK